MSTGWGRRGVAVLLGLGALAWLVTPPALVWWLERGSSDLALTERAVVWLPLEANSEPVVTEVDLALVWSEPGVVVAPALGGLVEKVFLDRGDELRTGTAVLRANGITRLAAATDAPFTRPLPVGARGPDVTDLHRVLDTLGLRHGSSDVVTSATMHGVRELAASIGAGDQDVFDPNWVVFLPAPMVTVEGVELTVGAPVPAPGAVIITGAVTLDAATLTTPGSVSTEEPPHRGGPPAVDEEVAPAWRSEDVAPMTAPPGARLLVSDHAIEVDETRHSVAVGALQLLAKLVDPGERVVKARLEVPSRPGEYRVPAAALFPGADGVDCILRRRDGRPAPVPVRLVGGSFDWSVVRGALAVGDDVALAPPARARRCIGVPAGS